MKELKFRVWEEREKEYDTWSYILDESGNLYRNTYGALIECDKKDYIIEQYTGLKDKNGKEIYEGDIVAVKDDDIPFALVNALTTEKWLVRFNKHRASFTMVKSTRRRNFIRTFQNTKQDDIEVIGNIHENDDLLEKK